MNHFEKFEFDGLSVFLQRVADYGPELSYVIVSTHPNRVQLHRMELDADALNDWLSTHVEQPPQPKDWASIVAGLDVWARSVMSADLSPLETCEFHIQAVLAKGEGRPVGSKVVIQGQGWDDTPELENPVLEASPKLPMPKPELSEADTTEISRNFHNIGEQYSHVANLVLTNATQLQDMLREQVADQREANAQLREANSQLRLDNRAMLARLEAQVHSQRDQSDASSEQVYGLARLQVANNAVGQVAGTLQQFLALQAGTELPPQLQVLANAIRRSPILLAAIQDPDVQTLLQDQEVLTHLATQLRAFAAMRKGVEAQTVPEA